MAQMLALYKTAESAAQATEALDSAGVTNEEWSLFHRLAYRMNADLGELARNLTADGVYNNGRVYFLINKTSGNY